MTKPSSYGTVTAKSAFTHSMNMEGKKHDYIHCLSFYSASLTQSRFVNHVEFHPMGTCIAAACTDSTVKVGSNSQTVVSWD